MFFKCWSTLIIRGVIYFFDKKPSSLQKKKVPCITTLCQALVKSFFKVFYSSNCPPLLFSRLLPEKSYEKYHYQFSLSFYC